MKYKVGDKVRIKPKFHFCSVDGFNNINMKDEFFNEYSRLTYCETVMTIGIVNKDFYILKEDKWAYKWTDEMIEGLVEEETSLCEGCCSLELKYNKLTIADNICTDKVEIILQDYELKKEGDKWFAVKKKKEYPKTYDECCKVLNVAVRDLDILDNMLDTTEIIYNKNLDRLLNSFRKLLICRDAYWKIAGEEMGLGKPWKPNLFNDNQDKFVLANWDNNIEKHDYSTNKNYILTFTTEEMRNAFKENFDSDIKICKEFL